MTLIVIDDLFFRSKIEAAARQLNAPATLVAHADDAVQHIERSSWRLVIVDLSLASSDSIALVEQIRRVAPAVPILGFCSHIETSLEQRARAAGCTWVCPRSVFVRMLPKAITGQLRGEDLPSA